MIFCEKHTSVFNIYNLVTNSMNNVFELFGNLVELTFIRILIELSLSLIIIFNTHVNIFHIKILLVQNNKSNTFLLVSKQ